MWYIFSLLTRLHLQGKVAPKALFVNNLLREAIYIARKFVRKSSNTTETVYIDREIWRNCSHMTKTVYIDREIWWNRSHTTDTVYLDREICEKYLQSSDTVYLDREICGKYLQSSGQVSSNSIILSETQDRVSSIKWACFESVLNSINLWISGFSWILSLFYMINYRFWASWRKSVTPFFNFFGYNKQTSKQTDRHRTWIFWGLYTKSPFGAINHLAFKSFSDPLK